MLKRILFISVFAANCSTLFAQNILEPLNWTIGYSNIIGFNNYGSSEENGRVLTTDHIGNEIIAWQASPNGSIDADGGWTTSYRTIDPTKTYRLSVWLKKINSFSGTSAFGCQSFFSNSAGSFYCIENMDGTINMDPLFWSGDLPELNKWYLLIAYVFTKNDTGGGSSSFGTTSMDNFIEESGIYDGETGEKIVSVTNFQFSGLAENISHRAFLSMDGNLQDKQIFYSPRIDEVNSNEPTLQELLSINPNSKLVIGHDDAGNRLLRIYSLPPDPRPFQEDTTSIDSMVVEDLVSTKNILQEKQKEGQISDSDFSNQFYIYPNPTKQIVHIEMEGAVIGTTGTINLYNENGKILRRILKKKGEKQLFVDFSMFATGTYLVRIVFDNGKAINRKIIKE